MQGNRTSTIGKAREQIWRTQKKTTAEIGEEQKVLCAEKIGSSAT